VRISRAQPMGRDGKHSKIWCDTLEILAWRRQPHELPAAGTEIEIACVPQLNTFRGSQRLQLELRDHRAPRRWHDHRSFLREMWAICRQGLTATPEELAARLRADVDSCWQGLAVLHRSGAVKCRRLSGGYVEVSPMGEPQHVHLDTRKLQAALRRASEDSPSGSWPTAPRGC
jgi:hypothetical protein